MLGFDFGAKRTGVAVGELALGLAHPLTVIEAEGGTARLEAAARLVAEWRPALLVVGLPRHADGTEHDTSRACRRFARRLQARCGLPVELVDERLTSAAAASALREAGARRGRARAALDAVAAQQILQTWFEERRRAAA